MIATTTTVSFLNLNFSSETTSSYEMEYSPRPLLAFNSQENVDDLSPSADFIKTLMESPNSTEETESGGNLSVSLIAIANSDHPHEYEPPLEYIFDRVDVRAFFMVLYTIVFCTCFFGNLMVILVVTLHWRMRSITNFCLANLAFADLCVGIFCVYQNIVTYLMESWVFGEFMCKMYHFINSLSTTASVLILVVISVERYFAIIYPLKCKQILTATRLRVVIALVWTVSALISSPRFYYFSTLVMPLPNGKWEILCLPNRLKYNSKMMDLISMTTLFLVPLGVMTILYTHIGIVLWKSNVGIIRNTNRKRSLEEGIETIATAPHCYRSNIEMDTTSTSMSTSTFETRRQPLQRVSGALQSRRRVIRMLIVVVLTFAISHLPFHMRKLWQYWSPSWAPYQAGGVFSTLFTPITFLIMYANSGVNPILYAFMSQKFRSSFRDLLCCRLRPTSRNVRNSLTVSSTKTIELSVAVMSTGRSSTRDEINII